MKVLSIALASIFIMPALFAADLPQGYVVGWGHNPVYGCDGVPFLQSYSSTGVVTIAGQILTNAVAISAGSGHRLALLSDGIVFGWGNNTVGQTTGLYSGTEITNGLVKIDGEVLSNAVAICAGSGYSLVLKKDGRAISFGYDHGASNALAGLNNIVAISGNLALKDDGTVAAWGNIDGGQKTTAPAGLSNVVATAVAIVGGYENFALKKDGTVVGWYGNGHLDDSMPAGLSNVVAIATGSTHHLALKSDSTVFGWGVNGSGEATGVATSDLPRISSGLVTLGGEVLTNIVAIAASGSGAGYSLALKKDGTLVSWGYSPFNRMDVPAGLSNVVAIAVGDNYCLAITTNRAVAEKFRH